MSKIHSIAVMLCLLSCVMAQGESGFITDPNDLELQALAKPFEIDESKYGCGPLLKPGKTYYVSLQGDDAADGVSWRTAWRHPGYGASRLSPGDTLLIGEGEYCEVRIRINVGGKQYWAPKSDKGLPVPQVGEPGRPIRIMAAPRQRVVITSARKVGPFRRTPGARYTYEAEASEPRDPLIWESDSLVSLQNAGSLERVDELPGTYCFDAEQKKLYVRFSDARPGEGRTVHVRPSYAPPFRIHGSYVHVKGLWFKHCSLGIILRSNIDKTTHEYDPKCGVPRGGEHNTIEECVLLANGDCGLNLTQGARWNRSRTIMAA